jgi:SnoaL-like domain
MRKNMSGVAAALVALALMWTVPARTASHDDEAKHGDQDDLKQHHARIRADKIRELYHDVEFPNSVQVITGQKSVAHIFAAGVRGRVTPVGHFHDEQAVSEYFFGLAATPTSRVTTATMRSLAVSGDKVAVEVDIHFEKLAGGGFTLRQTGFFTFDDDDLVSSFDLSILNLGAAVNPTSAAEREASIQGVCAVLTTGVAGQPATCRGENAEYADFNDCVTFMRSVPYGTWDRANSNTFVCRQFHTLLTPFRPDVHCPHAGKTGGGMCVDVSYQSFFDEEF